jgi:hypothetical protein
MKLKEWGFMRHKPRRTGATREGGRDSRQSSEDTEQDERESSATVEAMTIDPTPTALCEKRGGWQVVPEPDLVEAEPTFMGMLHQTPRYLKLHEF